jgi:hypothetical protein
LTKIEIGKSYRFRIAYVSNKNYIRVYNFVDGKPVYMLNECSDILFDSGDIIIAQVGAFTSHPGAYQILVSKWSR